MSKLISTNPANNYEVLWSVLVSTKKEIKEKVKLANKTKSGWKELWIKKRIELLKPIYEEFEKRKNEIAELITKEMWKPISESEWEVKTGLDYLKWYLENVESVTKDEITQEDEKSLHKIIYEPIWTVAVITPWNFPFRMAIAGVVPNLLVWNTVVFKTSEECPLVWKLIEEVINMHNLPKWVFSEVYWDWKIWNLLVNEDIDFIWFTWSTKVGQSLYQIASKKFIKVLLELWWSNPSIVFPDTKAVEIAEILYNKRFRNCWQVCAAVKRAIIHESVFDEVILELKNIIEKKKLWNPMERDTEIWSLVAKRQVKVLEEQLNDAIKKWAKIVVWWRKPSNLKWAFFESTILTQIKKNMKVWNEEVFGPILSVVKFKTEEEAIELANDTIYWLWANIITKDIEKAIRVASRIDAGKIDINNPGRCLLNPFWWCKKSWIWRENWVIWFKELCQIKVISISK